ncbi:hypothetical protein ACEPAI_8379 [Sanghuangporus weigelae]
MPGDDRDLPPTDETGIGRPRTPPNTEPPAGRSTKETPARPRSVHSSSYWDGTLGEKRLMLLEELGYAIPEIGVNPFINFILPPLKHGIDVGAIISSLRSNKVIGENGRWTTFPYDPGSSKNENIVFQPLEDVFTQVVEAASHQVSGLAQTFVLRLLPNDVPQSERASKTRPDGCVVLKEAEDLGQEADNIVYRWYDFALTCEFKLRDTDEKRDDVSTEFLSSNVV